MPLQWKKAMNTQVSQLVNDHLRRSQKRRDGSSLFVETGFPTSLVDLFIKNREKLKKSSKKKRQIPPVPIAPRSETNDPVIAGGSTMISPSITRLPLRSPPASPPRVPCEGLSENRAVGGSIDGSDEREYVSEPVIDANTVLLVVLKMFFVVVLALGTKRLTVGITISAFLLFFLEYVGKRAQFALKPVLESKWVLGFFSLKKVVNKDEKINGVLMLKLEEEIQPVNVFETQPENEIVEGSGLGCQEIESIESSGVELNKRKSRKEKITSKMKKLVPKKLKSSRKGSGSQRGKTDEEEDYSISSRDEQSVQCEDGRGSENFSSELSSGWSLRNREEEEEDKMRVIRSVGERLETDEKIERLETDEKIEEIGNGLNWRYLVLCVIVLAGLIGGRGLAVLLTLSWFVILKFGEILMRYTQVPMIKPAN